MKLEKKLARTGGARQRALGRVGTAAERATLRAAAAAAHESGSIAKFDGARESCVLWKYSATAHVTCQPAAARSVPL